MHTKSPGPRSILPLCAAALAGLSAAASGTAPGIVDFNDPDYGTRVRQLRKDDGHEHNLYYYREPWNADGTRMAGVQSDLDQKNWRVCLYDGDGAFIKELFAIDRYDWRLCWDRKNPDVLYTWKGDKLYRFNAATGQADLLRSFAPLALNANGPSLNQAGDRILVVTSDKAFRSYRLPDMSDERAFKLDVPPDCQVAWDKPHYTGYRNYVDTAYRSADRSLTEQAIVLHDDTGAVVHKFEGLGGGGHYDWSPDGKLAYFKMHLGTRSPGGPRPLEVHVVNVDGTSDRLLWSVPREQAVRIQNLHLSWPKKVDDWFIASLFPYQESLPSSKKDAPQQGQSRASGRGGAAPDAPGDAPLDQIVRVNLDGTTRYLAHAVTWTGAGRSMFWAEPLAVARADGARVCFHTRRSGTIDLCVLFTGEGASR